eukprot:GHVP01034222.1.p1 GENE.GHVP01034222.1~~GHVP01034222.1.p1  ORF type:complete len:191 (+),score=9.32 GHVP01034222.1:185-757(+)
MKDTLGKITSSSVKYLVDIYDAVAIEEFNDPAEFRSVEQSLFNPTAQATVRKAGLHLRSAALEYVILCRRQQLSSPLTPERLLHTDDEVVPTTICRSAARYDLPRVSIQRLAQYARTDRNLRAISRLENSRHPFPPRMLLQPLNLLNSERLRLLPVVDAVVFITGKIALKVRVFITTVEVSGTSIQCVMY